MKSEKKHGPHPDVTPLLTPLSEAIEEIKRRRQDSALVKAVNDFLEDDVPEYFKQNNPVIYLARHVATPSYETLRFIELAKPFGLPIVIGQDPKDKFVSNNSMKRALGKLPVVKGVTKNKEEIIEYFTIVDFDKVQGKQLGDIRTNFDKPLVEFHNDLLKKMFPKQVMVFDDSEWINRKGRGNLFEHYKQLLSLYIVHGVMLECYIDEDDEFVQTILKPTYKFVEEKFGVKPLIANLVDDESLNLRNWYSYPKRGYKHLQRAAAKNLEKE